ncbi:GDSL-type esterase/lipase family protein [Paenibacillus pasadenensis]|uniref:GDSL-type esterase/lipase family protein n=1 Tax=Paenibacillus pasadenensis TaxID=217090 RepID=UPI00203F3794|nr:GDSL-type esterase/lipase family protein [Paenibacillus pasadenensis]MCM3747061.1 GDSL-type esterase/lipase family protein [Paenibacillus pasadenensis]
MKKNTGFGMLLIAIVLLLAACGNQTNDGGAAATPEPKPTAVNYKELYRTSVFFGDSITEGLSYHDVLNKENVLAGAGKTAEFALMEDDVAKLADRKPEHVFIQLGSTDILWPTENPKEYSMKQYAKLIDAIKAKLPDAAITLLSVTPVTAEAEKLEPRYANIADYNEGLKALAAEKQAKYIDLTALVAEHTDLYDTDGIHFQAAFYPFLLEYLSKESK